MTKGKNQTALVMQALSVIFWLSVWYMASKIVNQEFLLASPDKVLLQTAAYFREKSFWNIIFNSFFHILAGFSLAIVSGITAAVLSYRFKFIKILLNPLMAAIKSVTTASVIILFLVWSKSEYLSITVSLFMTFPVIYSSILKGLSEVDRDLLEMAQVFKIPPLKRVIYIYISQILPYFESAGTASLGLAWKAGIAAEVIGLPENTIGINLYESKIYLNTVNLFSWTVIIVILGFLSEKLFLFLVRSYMKGIEGGRI